MVPILTYNKNKTKDMAVRNIYNICKDILDKYDFNTDLLSRMAGSICYSSLFLIPDFDLINGGTYTIENICYHVIGLKTVSFNTILTALANISFGKNVKENLQIVLSDCMFPEIIYDLGLSCKDVYCVLLIHYLLETDTTLVRVVYDLYRESNSSYHTLSSYFEREVFPQWKI